MPTVSATRGRSSAESSGPVGLGVVVGRNDLQGPADRLVEQSFEPDRVARAGFERPAVVAQHRAEADVLEFHVVAAHQLGGGEKLLEMERLAMIDHVENGVGPPGLHAVADRGQVGRAVEERPVFLPHDHRRLDALEEDADGAVGFPGDAALQQIVDDRPPGGPRKSSRPACGRT